MYGTPESIESAERPGMTGKEPVRGAKLAFWQDEQATTTIENVIILLIAVIILAALILYFNTNVWTAVKKWIQQIIGSQPSQS